MNSHWQNELKNSINNNYDLLKTLNLPTNNINSKFKLKAPLSFVKKMQPNNPYDPLLLQVLIQNQENIETPGYSPDPLAEKHYNPEKGIIHKYKNRALIILAGGCAINCRYCFRRHFEYSNNQTNLEISSPAFKYIKNNKSIKEIILSGGDPLLHNDEKIKQIITNIEQIEHIKTIRIHTRLPIVIPSRVTNNLVATLQASKLNIVIVTHCNHSQELDELTKTAFDKLASAKITLLNQSVLLKNINDSPKALIELSYKLFSQKIIPYYIHALDPVQGSQHFFVDMQQLIEIEDELKTELPGYLVPKFVKDGANQNYKLPISNKVAENNLTNF
jgi:EF-P beta-lysylation protein EpmB